MKRRSWNAAVFGIWVAALAGVVTFHPSREGSGTGFF